MKYFRFSSVFSVLLFSVGVYAQDDADSRIKKLEKRIEILESRVVDLESKNFDKKVNSSSATNKTNWRKLEKGMSENDVKNILGEPDKIIMYGTRAVWYYGIPSGGHLEIDYNTRTLNSWSEP